MKTTVVIPNYNGKHFLKNCLTSLFHQTKKEFYTLVIDNGSSDGSVDYIKEQFPWIKVLSLKKNYGFCKAVNRGIQIAKTPYVLLLNNDTEVEPDFVEELEKAMERHPKAFSVSSKMLRFQKRDRIDDAGDLYCLVGWQFQRGIDRAENCYKKEDRIFSACAGAAIYRRTVFEKIGYFDEQHFAYLEDMDIGFRARIYGYENWFNPNAKVYHVGSGTSGSKYNSFKVKLSARNSVYMNYKNMPFGMLCLNLLPLSIGYLVKWIFFVHQGFGRDYAAGIGEGIQKASNLRKVSFAFSHIWNYIEIEWELIRNCFLYGYEFFKRRTERSKLRTVSHKK